jgi:WS/DGAT/MGAT family acyltransferase
MASKLRFERRMSDSDALMWSVEQDPQLRSTISVIWLLDRPAELARLRHKVERAVALIPRLRERVVADPLGIAPPVWEDDPHFDLGYHLRALRAPGDATLRALFDLAQPIAMQEFDRARPLWELYAVEGLAQARGALLMKLHHAVSDGVGLVRMTEELVERSREGRPPRERVEPEPAHAEPPSTAPERLREALAHERRRQAERAVRVARALGRGLRSPVESLEGARAALGSVGRMLRPIDGPMSPVMRGRSLSVRFDAMLLPLEDLKRASKCADGRLNDAFMAGLAGGFRIYHQAKGQPVERLRVTMPINLREGEEGARAGNQFAPARFELPVGEPDPVARMKAIRELVVAQRGEPALGLLEDVAGVLNRLPVAVSTTLFGSMLKGIDFVASNVPGPRFDVFVAGAHIDAIFGFGPLAGAAVNATLFSYRDRLHLGLATDPAAVPDPQALLECMEKGFAEVLACAQEIR